MSYKHKRPQQISLSPSPNLSANSTPDENERLLAVPAFHISPSTEELGCYFTISSTGSTYASEVPTPVEGIKESPPQIYQQKRTRRNKYKMSQDAEDGPEVLFVEPRYLQKDPHAHLYNATRPPMNQDEFDQRFHYRPPPDADRETCRRSQKFFRHYYRPCLSGDELMRFILRLVPILNWLPRYPWRQNLLNDAIGGLIVGVMHVPQGIAYAKLAGVDAVVGLYTSFLPPLFYMLFGTSRHNSIGSFAVVSLMSGAAVSKFMAAHNIAANDDSDSAANSTIPQNGLSPEIISSTLACCVGLLQILMGILRLELITTYFSDQVVAGFTTGASMHVFAAQLKDIFGLRHLPTRSGAGYLFMKIYDIFSNIHHTNLYTFSLAMTAIVFLCLGKEVLNPWLKRRFHLNVPIPIELVLMVFATAFAQLFHFHSNFDIKIVDKIPTGMPPPMLPQVSLMPSLLPDALGIAAVVIAVHISLAKMFAKKKDYRVDPSQELFALGFSSSLASLIPVYPVSCSLGRTLVNVEAGTKTQLSTIFSSAFLFAIILYFGNWLRTLPMCILSAIIVVALKGIFKKITDLRTLWPLSKIDFSIWLVSFLATVCWDVTQGLALSICFALMTTVFRTQWPRWHFLANLSGTNDFRDAERYELVCSYPGICIFRFDSPLLFTNIDNFKETIHKAFRRWNRYQGAAGQMLLNESSENGSTLKQRKSTKTSPFALPQCELVPADLLSPADALKNRHNGKLAAIQDVGTTDDDEDSNNSSILAMRNGDGTKSPPSLKITPPKPSPMGMDVEQQPTPIFMAKSQIYYRHFIVDCSGFTFVDCMGVNALKEIFTEMRNQRVLVYFAATKAPVRDLFEKCGFFQYVQKHNFYPTIRDAVAIARKRRNASTQHLLDEPAELHYDEMEVMQSTQPMN